MLTIQIKLPWERYHAHPWGQNPGRVAEAEWPPSPWRLLRSLSSAWFRAKAGQPALDELRTLLETLAKELPQIGVGKVAFAKTVHYQPNFKHPSSNAALATYGKTRHENLFAATAAPFYFRWQNTTLDAAQIALLETLLVNVSYFGRADSICEAAIVVESEISNEETGWCEPCLDANGRPRRRIAQNCRDVFCPNPSDFKASDLWLLRANCGEEANTPAHLVNQMLGADMKVDGGIPVSYVMPAGWPQKWEIRTALRGKTNLKRSAPSEGEKVAHHLRFSLQCRVPVVAKFTVPLAEMFQGAAIWHLKKVFGDKASSPAISGKTESGEKTTGHRHAFYLPLCRDASQPGIITDLHVWCPMGFTKAEMDIFQRVRQIRWGNGRFPINPILVAAGKQPPPEILGGTGRVWASVTPFVPPLHFYRGVKNKPECKANALPEKQLFDNLRKAGIEKTVLIERMMLPGNTEQCRWDIVRAAENDVMEGALAAKVHKNGSDGSFGKKERRIGFFMRLTFDESISLPFPAFGHSSHFGLGLFLPVEE
jgi:CRISPR-associated protein Csb2